MRKKHILIIMLLLPGLTSTVMLPAQSDGAGKTKAQGQKERAGSVDLSEPQIFAEGIICTGDYESHAAFSPSGDTLYFIKSAPDFSTWTICVSYRRNGQWSMPAVAHFSGKYKDADPFFTKDGRTLYFISDRPLTGNGPAKGDMDIWRIDRTATGWSEPIHLDAPVNSDKDEYYPTMADNGTLYFGSERLGGLGGCDIYRCKPENGAYILAENLGAAVNTDGDEYEPFIAPDERYMIFMAARPSNTKGDLFVSYNRNGQWTTAEKLPYPFSSDRSEYAPKVTRDGRYFFFSSTRNRLKGRLENKESIIELNKRVRGAGNGLGDIYQVNFSSLNLKL